MSRLVWALVLAFVAHLALFQIQMPEQEQAQLTLAGSAHVSVRLARSILESVDKVAAEPEPEIVPVVEPEPERVEVAEAVEEIVAPPVLPPAETAGEKDTTDAVKVKEIASKTVPVREEQPAVRESAPTVEANTQQVAEPVLAASAADGPESAGSSSPVTQAIGQAEPLTAVNRPPVYPPLARRRGWQGTVMLEVDVDSTGLVQAVRTQKSSSYSLLDREALAAVRKWRFVPGSRNGTPVASKVVVPVHFMLQSD